MINDWSVEGPSIFCGYECFGIFPLQEDYSANWGLRLDGRREHNAASFEWMAGIAERLHPGISTNMADGSSKTCFGVGVAFQVCCSLVELSLKKRCGLGLGCTRTLLLCVWERFKNPSRGYLLEYINAREYWAEISKHNLFVQKILFLQLQVHEKIHFDHSKTKLVAAHLQKDQTIILTC